MKKIILKLAVLFSLLSVSYTAVFADDGWCATCSNTSPVLEQYLTFSDEIIQTLKSATSKNDSSAGTLLDRIAQNLNEKSQNALTYNVLVTTVGSRLVKDINRQELLVLKNEKALKRDWDKLNKIDEQIADIIFDLWQKGAYMWSTQEYLKKLDSITDKYAKKNDWSSDGSSNADGWGEDGGPFLEKSWSPSLSLVVLIAAIWDMNQWYKRFIAYGDTDAFDAFSEKYEQDFGVILSDVNYTTLVEQYSCARGMKACDGNYQKFEKNMESIKQNSEEKAQEAISKIKKSLIKLKCAFAKENSVECDKAWFTEERENDGQTDKKDEEKGSSAEVANKMDHLGDAFATQINELKDIYLKKPSDESPPLDPSKRASLDIISADSISRHESLSLSGALNSVVDETIAVSKGTWQHHVFADPLVVTKKIPRISVMVQSWVTTIGNAEKQKTITDNLGKACESQCTNLWGTCYYY